MIGGGGRCREKAHYQTKSDLKVISYEIKTDDLTKNTFGWGWDGVRTASPLPEEKDSWCGLMQLHKFR